MSVPARGCRTGLCLAGPICRRGLRHRFDSCLGRICPQLSPLLYSKRRSRREPSFKGRPRRRTVFPVVGQALLENSVRTRLLPILFADSVSKREPRADRRRLYGSRNRSRIPNAVRSRKGCSTWLDEPFGIAVGRCAERSADPRLLPSSRYAVRVRYPCGASRKLDFQVHRKSRNKRMRPARQKDHADVLDSVAAARLSSVCVWRWGWSMGVTHTAIVAVLCLMLTEILLVRFRKIPFTCAAPAFKSSALVTVVFYFLGFAIFTSGTSTAERWALEDPLRYLVVVPALAG